MGYRRIFIIRKDLGLSPGKLAAMVGHCAESYWTNLIKDSMHGDDCFLNVDMEIYNNYINGIFTKTICEAKNLNQLMKAKSLAEEMGMVEGKDFFVIADKCLTELKPEYIDDNGDGRTIVGIAFKPLPDEIAHKISKKYHLYMG
jgi:peptidyl-tRNA hydrolase